MNEIERQINRIVEQGSFSDAEFDPVPEPEPEVGDEEEKDFDEILQTYCDENRIRLSEPSLRDLEKLTRALGYRGLDDFLNDNPGAGQAVIQWIEEWGERIPEWREKLAMDDDTEL